MVDVQNFINNFRVVIASLPDREHCVCEIYYKHIEWAEISQEGSEIMIQFYPHPYQDCWKFPLDVALEIVQRAKKKFWMINFSGRMNWIRIAAPALDL